MMPLPPRMTVLGPQDGPAMQAPPWVGEPYPQQTSGAPLSSLFTPAGSLHGFGDPNAQENAQSLVPQLVPWMFAPDKNIIRPEQFFNQQPPSVSPQPANEALLLQRRPLYTGG